MGRGYRGSTQIDWLRHLFCQASPLMLADNGAAGLAYFAEQRVLVQLATPRWFSPKQPLGSSQPIALKKFTATAPFSVRLVEVTLPNHRFFYCYKNNSL